MLDIVIGKKLNALAADRLIAAFENVDWTGTLYVGYPVLPSVDRPIYLSALLTSLEHGVVAFDFIHEPEVDDIDLIEASQDDLYIALQQKLNTIRALRNGRRLAIEINVISLLTRDVLQHPDRTPLITTPEYAVELVSRFGTISEDQLKNVNAAMQQITTIKPLNRRLSVQRTNSRGAIMKTIEREIANLDRWQKNAAIETPDGVQRIRGLAGSGKTIVLALKAAFLHTYFPDWSILVTFHTRSLYQQFTDLIRRFYFELAKDEPDWEQLKILHSWGGAEPGVYSTAAIGIQIKPLDFTSARKQFGVEQAFGGACDQLLSEYKKRETKAVYDAVLIDEAQDLPRSFFELVYRQTRAPKRIIYAYDEFQNLSDYTITPPNELFGIDEGGHPNVGELVNEKTAPSRDVVLPICYRNTRWALTTAHALGLGTARKNGLVQFFEEPQLLEEIGYRTVSGTLELGAKVTIERRQEAHAEYFDALLEPDDALKCVVFGSDQEQAEWIAEQVHTNLTIDELDHKDILIVLPNAGTARGSAALIIAALQKRARIPAHLVGVHSDLNEIFVEGSIAVSGIYRAKGNEAPMVYVAGCEYGYEGLELIKRRNILFTAATRSRAWLRLCGVGEQMQKLIEEVNQVISNDYKLLFNVPTLPELQRLRRVHRERGKDERGQITSLVDNASALAAMLERGDVPDEVLPPEVLEMFRRISDRQKPN